MPLVAEDYYNELLENLFNQDTSGFLSLLSAANAELNGEKITLLNDTQRENFGMILVLALQSFSSEELALSSLEPLLKQVDVQNSFCEGEIGQFDILWSIANNRLNAGQVFPIMFSCGFDVNAKSKNPQIDVFAEIAKQALPNSPRYNQDKDSIIALLETLKLHGFTDHKALAQELKDDKITVQDLVGRRRKSIKTATSEEITTQEPSNEEEKTSGKIAVVSFIPVVSSQNNRDSALR